MGTRISQLPPKGANLANTDLLMISQTTTDGYESKSITGAEIIASAQDGVQPTLVSGTNIKTIEGQSLLGSGNIDLTKSDVGLSNVDNTSDANKPISTATQTALNAKQATLVSATNIKTINGNSLLGSGDLVVGGGLTIGTTAITSGTVGRVLFEGTGNVVQESANLFWNNTNSRLGIGTASPSALLHTVGSVTASGGAARGNYMQPTLVASANNDTLVGLDIAPTFTNGAFTGVQNISLRLIGASNRSMSLMAGDNTGNAYITNDTTTQITYTAGYGGHIFRFRDATNSSYPLYVAHNLVHGGNLSTSLGSSSFRWLSVFSVNISCDTYQFQGTNAMSFLGAVNTGIYFDLTNKHLNIFTNNSQIAKLFSTGNVGINTTTDAGYKLDVNGTARVQGKLSVNTPTATSAVMEVTSTTQGFLPPRMTNAQMVAIATPASGLMVYDTTNNKMCVYDGTAWQNLY